MKLSVQEYLDSVSNPSTKKGYKKGIKEFTKWYGKTAEEILRSTAIADVRKAQPIVSDVKIDYGKNLSNEEMISRLEKDMRTAAINLEFEKAAALRDEIKRIQES